MQTIKTIFFGVFTLIMLVAFVSSCSSDDDNGDTDNQNNNADQTTQIAEDGTWEVAQFIDSGNDETSDFTGFVFTFSSDGSLTANKGELSVIGTWSVTDSDSSSDDDNIDFNIFFDVPETNDFKDLNDDWDLVSATNLKIELVDVSGGNGGTDNLVFEKI